MNYECDLGLLAKDILSNAHETPFNKEMLESWRCVAVTANPAALYNTPELIEEYET